MQTCEYCSHDNINNNPGPCARCGVAGNPAGTPWGIRERRATKYWHKYNWNKLEGESATPQEHYNAANHKTLMDTIKPAQISKAEFLTVKEPAHFGPDTGLPETIEGICPVTPLPPPVPITEEEAEKNSEDEKKALIDWEALSGNGVGSILTLKEAPFRKVGGKFQLSSSLVSAPRYEFSLPPRVLKEEGQWSLLDNSFKSMRNINNKTTRTKHQGQNGTCFAFSGVDAAEWLTSLEHSAPYSAALYYNGEGLDLINLIEEIDEGGFPSNGMILTDINGGQLPINHLAGSNESGPFNYYKINNVDMPLIGSLKPNARQPSIPSTPNQWNITNTEFRPGHGVSEAKQWAYLCSVVHAGMVSSLAFYTRDCLNTKYLRGKDHYTPNMASNKGGHAVTVWGVKVEPTVAPKAKGLKGTDQDQFTDVKNNPYYDTSKTNWSKAWGEFKMSVYEVLKVLNKTIEFAYNKDGNVVLEIHYEGKKTSWADFAKYHKEEYDLIMQMIDRHLKQFVYHQPDGGDKNNTDTDKKGSKQEQEFQNLVYDDWTDSKNEKDGWEPDGSASFSGLTRWVLIHNSYGRSWGRDGFIWVNFDVWAKDLYLLDGYTQTTAKYEAIDDVKEKKKKQQSQDNKNKRDNNNRKEKQGKGNQCRKKPQKDHNHLWKDCPENPRNNPSPQKHDTTTPVQMRPRVTSEYQPSGFTHVMPELMVALDIDDTLVDTGQRMRSARRKGLFDPTAKGDKQHPKGRDAFLEFFYSSERFHLDKAITGAAAFAHDLVKRGYKVAYITGRPTHTYEITKQQLKHQGFPLISDKYGADLLYCKPETASDTANWKKGILGGLQNNYDVRFFFDNNPKNLEVGRQLGIPGLYLAIDQYTGVQQLAERFKRAPAHIDNPNPDDDDDEQKDLRDDNWWANPPPDEDDDLFDESPWATNPTTVLPIYNGEPKGLLKNLGIVSAEVEVGRNIFADVGEGVQDIYKGLIGGRQSMTEKRMVMAVTELKAELSARAIAKGGQAVANLQVDFGSWQKSTVAVVAFGDAITLRGKKPVKGKKAVRANPGGKDATKLYRDFNGKSPDIMETSNITIPTTLVRIGEGGCWSVGYRSDKEGHGKKQKYIHEFGDFGRFPKKKPKKGDRKEPDLYAALDENGNVIDLRIIGGTFSLDVDPDSGINWVVG